MRLQPKLAALQDEPFAATGHWCGAPLSGTRKVKTSSAGRSVTYPTGCNRLCRIVRFFMAIGAL
jgi:hypothetical protein